MNGTVNARVRRVVIGHSERALIHAVDGANLEFKIEVPSEAVRGVVPGQELMLTLSWTLQPVVTAPVPRETAAPAARAPTPLPSAVDEEFMALMARRRGSPTVAVPTAGPSSYRTVSAKPGSLMGSSQVARVDVVNGRVLAALEGIRRLDIGGLEISYSPDDHTGLDFADLSIIGSDGKFKR